jgi:hypothetical protein
MITFLQATNRTLAKLRKAQVTTLVGSNEYTQLVAAFVNEIKEEIEDAWDWSYLQTTISVTSVAGQGTYSLVGSGEHFDIYDAWCTSVPFPLNGPMNLTFIHQLLLLTNNTQGTSNYFAFSGEDANGDQTITFAPTPTASGNTYNFYGYIRQNYLNVNSDDNTSILIPWRPLVLGAYAKAVSERGEDGGVSYAEADLQYRNALADAIAVDVARQNKNTDWTPV